MSLFKQDLMNPFIDPFRMIDRPVHRFQEMDPFYPSMDLEEGLKIAASDYYTTNKDVHIDVELPGVPEDCIELELKHGFLKLHAKVKTSNIDEAAEYKRRERTTLEYTGSWKVPDDLDFKKVKATLSSTGILNIQFPKTKSMLQKSENIEIQVEKEEKKKIQVS